MFVNMLTFASISEINVNGITLDIPLHIDKSYQMRSCLVTLTLAA